MRGERSGKFSGRSVEDDDNFAVEIEAGEVIVIVLGNLEAITGEDERRADFGRRHDAGADDGVFAENERFALAIADEGEAAILFDDLARDEAHGLVETVRSCWLRVLMLKLFDRVFLRFALATAARVSAFEFVIGEELDVVPPSLAVEIRRSLGGDG